jgi:methyltransferase (TIGR00027 family)
VEHIAPGTGAIRAEAHFPASEALAVRRQLIEKGRAKAFCDVEIYQGSKLVATARSEYRLIAQRPVAEEAPATPVREEKEATVDNSALLIAGLRDDSISRSLAGERGRALAERFSEGAPQLSSMIRARGLHVESILTDPRRQFEQVVVLGLGLDPKPILYSSDAQRWFGVDLPHMLPARARRLADCGVEAQNFRAVPSDLSRSGWTRDLLNNGFDPNLSTLFILEGVSMYLPGKALTNSLNELSTLMRSTGSRLWLDHVSANLMTMENASVNDFLQSLRDLGEPFRSGFDNPASLSERWVRETSSSAADVAGVEEPVHSEYMFSLLQIR